MNTTPVTIAAVFGVGLAAAPLLGMAFKVKLRDRKYSHLDGLRAIAALMVVCSHYLAHAALIAGATANNRLMDAFGAVGVQIFFSITGFLFTTKALSGPVDIADLVKSRVKRILPLYFVAMTAAVIVAVHIARAGHIATPVQAIEIMRAYTYGVFVSAPPVVAGMSIAGQAGQMWTLAWEWRFYVLVPFLGVLLARRAWSFGALALFVVAMMTDQYNGSLPPWAFFLPGVVCAVVERRIKPGTSVRVALAAIGAAAFVGALVVGGPVNGIGQTALCAVGFPCVLFGHKAVLSVRPLRLLGEVSYSIYLLHLTVASIFWAYVQSDAHWMFYQTPASRLPAAAVTLVGLFVLSFITYALLERPFTGNSKERPVTSTSSNQVPVSSIRT